MEQKEKILKEYFKDHPYGVSFEQIHRELFPKYSINTVWKTVWDYINQHSDKILAHKEPSYKYVFYNKRYYISKYYKKKKKRR